MRPSESTNVFVSYSHADALLVSPVVKLLRVNKSLVLQDIDDIQPGKRWQGEILFLTPFAATSWLGEATHPQLLWSLRKTRTARRAVATAANSNSRSCSQSCSCSNPRP